MSRNPIERDSFIERDARRSEHEDNVWPFANFYPTRNLR